MRISRLYFEGELLQDARVDLPADSSHYVLKVLRLKSGDTIRLFNGQAGEYEGSLLEARKDRVNVRLERQIRTPETALLRIHLGLGVSRGDRMDFAIQKATELGVTSITPIYSRYGEVRIKQAERLENKLRHWRKIAVNACEQCGRVDIPPIGEPWELDAWLPEVEPSTRLLMDPGGDDAIAGLAIEGAVSLLIGPEGGFAEEEVSLARRHGFAVVALGPRVLRTETAPVAALAILQHLYGDM